MAKKKYSVMQRKAYHEKRASDMSVSENKRFYSRQWLDGFNDRYAKNNYAAVQFEISSRKNRKIPRSDYDIGLQGYKNGLSAQLKNNRP